MDENHQTFKFTFSGQFKQQPVFPKEQLSLASEADRTELERLDFFEEGEIDRFLQGRSIYLYRADGEYICLGTVLSPYWRTDITDTTVRDIGMHVSTKHRGKGYGRSMVQNLTVLCLESGYILVAECLTDNLASKATLESAGFTVNEG